MIPPLPTVIVLEVVAEEIAVSLPWGLILYCSGHKNMNTFVNCTIGKIGPR